MHVNFYLGSNSQFNSWYIDNTDTEQRTRHVKHRHRNNTALRPINGLSQASIACSACFRSVVTNLTKQLFFLLSKVLKVIQKTNYKKSKLTDATHLHFQITNLISSYSKKQINYKYTQLIQFIRKLNDPDLKDVIQNV